MFIIPLVPTINKWNKIDISMFPKTNCTAITVFNGKLDSTHAQRCLPRLTKFIKDLTYLNTNSLDILIGILLGDAYLKKETVVLMLESDLNNLL